MPALTSPPSPSMRSLSNRGGGCCSRARSPASRCSPSDSASPSRLCGSLITAMARPLRALSATSSVPMSCPPSEPLPPARTLLACAFFACMVIPYFAVGTFIAQVMAAMSLTSAYAGGLIYNVALFGGAIAGVLVVEHLSRRQFLIGSFTITTIAMLVLTVWTHVPAAAMTGLFAIFAGVLSASSILVYVYLPELFPTDLRASGIGLASAVSRIGSAISTFLLPIIVAAYGIRTALGACVAALAVGALICQRWAPE